MAEIATVLTTEGLMSAKAENLRSVRWGGRETTPQLGDRPTSFNIPSPSIVLFEQFHHPASQGFADQHVGLGVAVVVIALVAR
jgi:hypothetical protein